MIETKEIMSREAVTGGIFECRYDESLTLTQADNSLFRLLGMNAGSLKSGTPISFLDRICAEDRPIFLEKIRYQLSRSRVFMSELHIMTAADSCGGFIYAASSLRNRNPPYSTVSSTT